jgi:hypothetical protein
VRVDTIIKAVTLGACLAITVDSALRAATGAHRRSLLVRPEDPPGPAATRPIAHTALGIDYSTTRKTVLLVVDSSCDLSAKSMPFYQRLIEATERAESGARVVATSIESRDTVTAFLARHGVRPNMVATLPVLKNSVQRTPTILVVDSRGTLQRRWVGLLSKSEEDAVIASITATP